jgi:hypothetical protein
MTAEGMTWSRRELLVTAWVRFNSEQADRTAPDPLIHLADLEELHG